MKHLVYKTTNLVNGKYYIGVHSCNCTECKYLGSGKALKAALTKYGRENFSREILHEVSTREEAFEVERQLVKPLDPLSYNLNKGGANERGRPKGVKLSLETRLKMSKSHKGMSQPSLSKPCEINGLKFKTQADAARHFKVHHHTIGRWVVNPNKPNSFRISPDTASRLPE